MTEQFSKDLLMFGAMAQDQFDREGGFKPEDRERLIEGLLAVGKTVGELTDKLLEDKDRTLDWVTEQTLLELNSAVRLMLMSKDVFIYNTIMLQGGRIAIESLRAGLGVNSHAHPNREAASNIRRTANDLDALKE